MCEKEKIKHFLWVNYTKNPRYKTFEFNEINVALTKQITLSNSAIRVIADSTELTLRSFLLKQSKDRNVVLGCVLFFGIYDVPEPPKSIDFWTVRQLMSEDLTLRTVLYPFQKQSNQENVQKEEETHDDAAIAVSYSVGKGMIISPQATIKYWDEKSQIWDSKGILDVEIDRHTGRIKFKTLVFAPCALVQDAFQEFPFEKWSLVTKDSKTTYQINGKWNDIEVEVSEKGVRLIHPMDERLSAEFESKYYSPSHFFMVHKNLTFRFFQTMVFASLPKWQRQYCNRIFMSQCR